MSEPSKSKEQLLKEIEHLKAKVAKQEKSETKRKQVEESKNPRPKDVALG
ncbi:MAG: hypothetical protein HQ541_21635 [Mariniphaga sp.]|nr:hypothetical protein [Mariniphaga sp.]